MGWLENYVIPPGMGWPENYVIPPGMGWPENYVILPGLGGKKFSYPSWAGLDRIFCYPIRAGNPGDETPAFLSICYRILTMSGFCQRSFHVLASW